MPSDLQHDLLITIETEECTPSLSQAQRMKQAAQSEKLDKNGIELVMQEEKPQQNKLVLKSETISKYFPKTYTPRQMEEVIVKLLASWQKKREQQR